MTVTQGEGSLKLQPSAVFMISDAIGGARKAPCSRLPHLPISSQ
jgi:hypothetical protein